MHASDTIKAAAGRTFGRAGVLLGACACVAAPVAHAQDASAATREATAMHASMRSEPQLIVPQRPLFVPEGQAAVRVRSVHATVRIDGRIATTELAITLANPGSRDAEAAVVLPVPDDAAVRAFGLDGLGEGLDAKLLPRDEARRMYDEIVRKMIDPGLLEFAGLGAVRSSVFPVPGHGEQVCRIVYEHPLESHRGRLDYLLPRSDMDALSPVPWTVEIEVKSAGELAAVFSTTHGLDTIEQSAHAGRYRVRNASEPGALRIGVLTRERQGMTVLATPDLAGGFGDGEAGSGGWFMLVAGGPGEVATRELLRREMTIVIDRSGSMRGEKLAQALEAARQVVAGLRPGELFNIVDYADTVRSFAPAPVVKGPASEAQALSYLDQIVARGSTNLHGALAEALTQSPSEGVLPLVLFLTDGLPTEGVVDEAQIRGDAEALNEHNRRVFTFGVGLDVNAPLLTSIAERTRAAGTFVLPGEDVETSVAQVWSRLDGPTLIEPRLTGDRISMALPAELGDLFKGEQIIVAGRYRGGERRELVLSGRLPDGSAYRAAVVLDPQSASVRHSAVARVWAQRRITELVTRIREAGAQGAEPDAERVDEIVRLSMAHGILTEYTAFLAAEETSFVRAAGDDPRAPSSALRDATADQLESRAVETRSGGRAVQQEMNNAGRMDDAAQTSNRYAYYDESVGGFRQQRVVGVQRAGDRTLFRRGQRWVDARILDRETETPDETIEFGTDAYFALASELSASGRQGLLANRGPVLLLHEGRRVLVNNPG